VDAQVDPRYVTLSAIGEGSVRFRSGSPGQFLQISKITVETAATGSGTVALYYKGQLVTIKSIALALAAIGLLNLAPGEELEARFSNGPANSEVKVTAHYVQAANVAPERGLTFTESVGFTDPVDNPVLLDSTTGGVTTSYFSPILDVRAYNSFGLNIETQNGGGSTFLATDLWELRVEFYADSAGSTLLFWDTYRMYPTNLLGSQPIRFTDQMHGAYMQLRITDPFFTGRNFRLTHSLYGSYRPMSNAYFRAAPDGVLYDNGAALAAGAATAGERAIMGHGWAMATLESGAGGVATMDIRLNGTAATDNKYRLVTTGANQRVTQQIILPKRQAFVVLTNNGAAPSTVRGAIYMLHQPF
jgi:hypothetical protein